MLLSELKDFPDGDIKHLTLRAFQSVRFDTEFEQNRVEVICEYAALLGRVGIALNPSLSDMLVGSSTFGASRTQTRC